MRPSIAPPGLTSANVQLPPNSLATDPLRLGLLLDQCVPRMLSDGRERIRLEYGIGDHGAHARSCLETVGRTDQD
jgi:hypothetical protein